MAMRCRIASPPGNSLQSSMCSQVLAGIPEDMKGEEIKRVFHEFGGKARGFRGYVKASVGP